MVTAAAAIERKARLDWVRIDAMRTSPLAQRSLRPRWVNTLASNLNPEQLGTPTVNLRDGHYYVIDGQHRVAALKLLDWGDRQIQCWIYEGLSEQAEAEKFLELNNQLTVDALSRFRIGVVAGLAEPSAIDDIARGLGLRVGWDTTDGTIYAVSTLRTVYRQAGPDGLARTLRIIRDAFGDNGFAAPVIAGLGLVCARYGLSLDDDRLVDALAHTHGGVHGLLGKARVLQTQTGNQRKQCVAAAAVEAYNRIHKGGRLRSWWKPDS